MKHRFSDIDAIVIGNLDGVHRGHQTLLKRAQTLCQDGHVLALTFWPHPTCVVRPRLAPQLLQTQAQRAQSLQQYGADHVHFIDFDVDFAALSPNDFVAYIFEHIASPQHIVVGFNFRFGAKGQGTTTVLKTLAAQHGATAHITEAVTLDDLPISSSTIRRLLLKGDLQLAAQLLGRPYTIDGDVIHGHGRGHALGFPTANIQTPNALLPPYGVYATKLHFDNGTSYQAVTNIGLQPTFQTQTFQIETHIMDFDGDFYGEHVRVELMKHMRAERRFPSKEKLIEQIRNDVDDVRNFFIHGE